MRQKTAEPKISYVKRTTCAVVLALGLPLSSGCVKKNTVQSQQPPITQTAAKQPVEDFLKGWEQADNAVKADMYLKGWNQPEENIRFSKTVKAGDWVMLPLKHLPNSIALRIDSVDEKGVAYAICSSFLGPDPCNPIGGPMNGKIYYEERKPVFGFTTVTEDGKGTITIKLSLTAKKGVREFFAVLTFAAIERVENLSMQKKE